MLLQVVVFALSFVYANTLPVGEHEDSSAVSYVSANVKFGGYNADDNGLGQGGNIVHISRQRPAYIQQYVTPVAQQPSVGPVYVASGHQEKEEDYAPPKYQYHYKVEDEHTNDFKYHTESRDGDVVRGEYSLKEADGTVRTVKYTVEKKSGFNAVVIKSGQAEHPQVQVKKTPQVRGQNYYDHY